MATAVEAAADMLSLAGDSAAPAFDEVVRLVKAVAPFLALLRMRVERMVVLANILGEAAAASERYSGMIAGVQEATGCD